MEMRDSVQIMGVLNVTPDSFFDGGRYLDPAAALRQAVRMRDQGADLIDVGGESTRPGARPVGTQEEIERVCPVIEAIRAEMDIAVSVDTYKSGVADAAVAAGASLVNDISGLTFDGAMAGVIARHGAGVVISHIRGTPETMQADPRYDDLIGEITVFLSASANAALEAGVAKDKIIVDPGIGFGKTLEDNYRIIRGIGQIKRLGFPVLVGLSRKSLIGKLYNDDSDRLPATIALNAVAVMNGADIIRVHDVREHRLAMAGIDVLRKVS
ncbi:MAG: dihydropteroate synthase [Spirochaetes bacterium]|nr:dihydropteroate synthase [Spirochaetota bacterium]